MSTDVSENQHVYSDISENQRLFSMYIARDDTSAIQKILRGEHNIIRLDTVNLNHEESCGFTPLIRAAFNGQVKMISLLTAAGADMEIANEDGFTALYMAVDTKEKEAAHELIKAGADLSRLSIDGKSPFDDWDIIDTIECFRIVGDPVEVTIKYRYNILFKKVLDALAQGATAAVCYADENAIVKACIDYDNEIILKYLIEIGCDIYCRDSQGRQLISLIKDKNLQSEIQRIFETRDKYPVHIALRKFRIDGVLLMNLISQFPQSLNLVDYFGDTAFLAATKARVPYDILARLLTEVQRLKGDQLRRPTDLLVPKGSKKRYPTFRLNIPFTSGKVYFEYTLGSDKMAVIGIMAHDHFPCNAGYGVGSTRNSIGFDGIHECFQHNGEIFIRTNNPIWKSGVVIGVAIDIDNLEASFYYNGTQIRTNQHNGLQRTNNISLSILGSKMLFVGVTIDNGENGTLNFGEADFMSSPPLGFVSIVSFCGPIFPRYLQYWNFVSDTWETVKPSDGFLVKYLYDWSYAVQNDRNCDAVKAVLRENLDEIHQFTDDCDEFGRRVHNIASVGCRKVIQSYLFFLGQYELTLPAEHKSNTSLLFLATHADTSQRVAIKLIKNKSSFEKELTNRDNYDPKYVIPILCTYNSDDDPAISSGFSHMKFDEYRYCIVMHAATRNLYQIKSQENISAKDWSAIKQIFVDAVNCASHMHSKGFIHGDIKELNIMRTIEGRYVLIDLDASVAMGSVIGLCKVSSAYCAPEMFEVCIRDGDEDPIIQLSGKTVAHESLDIWALGVVLYQLASSEPLLLSSSDGSGNLSSTEFRNVFDWSTSCKHEKLAKISDPNARNLLGQILTKDPTRRPSISRILGHPFLTNKTVVRLPGDKAKWDVFLSYRVDSESELAEILYQGLTDSGLSVYLDKYCLQDGVPWEVGFIEGLINSRSFIPLLSRNAINHTDTPHQNFSLLQASSRCDNVLLEHAISCELMELGYLDRIFPLFVGDVSASDTSTYLDFFKCGASPKCPDICVEAVERKIHEHFENQGLGLPLHLNRTVADIYAAITKFQGHFIRGDFSTAIEETVQKVRAMTGDIQASVDSISQGIVNMFSSVACQTLDSSSSVDVHSELVELKAQLEREKALREEKEDEIYRLREEKEEILRLREGPEMPKTPLTASAFLPLDTNELKKKLHDATSLSFRKVRPLNTDF